MKNSSFILILLIAEITVAQQSLLFESKIYFEDAIGNRDTIEIGYDTSAGSEYNIHLGELDLKNEFSSEFEVRASHSMAWVNNFKECILSKRITGACEKIIDITDPDNKCYAGEGIIFFIKAKHQPVKISWNQSDFEDGAKSCQGASFFTPDFIYHLVDPRTWINQTNKRYACAGKETEFIVNLDQNYIDSNYSKEYTYSTIRKFSNGIEDTILGVELNFEISLDLSPCQLISKTENQKNGKQQIEFVTIYPNPTTDYVVIDNSQLNPLIGIKIFDQSGRLLECFDESDINEVKNKVEVGKLESGIYFIQLRFADQSNGFKRFYKL